MTIPTATNKQIDNFRKCITFKKHFDTWGGTFKLGTKTFSYQSLKYRSAKIAKPEIVIGLYNYVVKFCAENGINLDAEVALQIKNKQK